MRQDSELGKWITEKFRSQVKFAEKVGAHPTMVSRWLTGKEGISPEYQDKIRGMKYAGSWPREEAKDPAGTAISAELFHRTVGQLEGRIGVLERALENLAEAYRAHILTGPERAHREGR